MAYSMIVMPYYVTSLMTLLASVATSLTITCLPTAFYAWIIGATSRKIAYRKKPYLLMSMTSTAVAACFLGCIAIPLGWSSLLSWPPDLEALAFIYICLVAGNLGGASAIWAYRKCLSDHSWLVH